MVLVVSNVSPREPSNIHHYINIIQKHTCWKFDLTCVLFPVSFPERQPAFIRPPSAMREEKTWAKWTSLEKVTTVGLPFNDVPSTCDQTDDPCPWIHNLFCANSDLIRTLLYQTLYEQIIQSNCMVMLFKCKYKNIIPSKTHDPLT